MRASEFLSRDVISRTRRDTEGEIPPLERRSELLKEVETSP